MTPRASLVRPNFFAFWLPRVCTLPGERTRMNGVGEMAMVGVAHAITNEIFHTAGKRIRTPPVAPDKLL